jgi:enamine deaminase RidA (YjgF/YER057c/UK114 family)
MTKPFTAVTAGPWRERYTFSPAVRAGNLLIISGTTATDDAGEIVGRGDIAAQTRHIFGKFDALLRAAGGSLADIVETTEYVTTTENYRATADVRRAVFGGPPYPAATGVIVAGLLREGALIEISAIAVLPDGAGATSGAGRSGPERAPEAP